MKTTNCFSIYTPDGKFHLSNYHIVIGMMLLAFLPMMVETLIFSHNDDSYTWITKYFKFLAPVAILAGIVLSLAKSGSYQPLHGDLNGVLFFGKDRIMVNERIFKIDDLSRISFAIYDYKGYVTGKGDGSLDGKYSQGVNNSLTIYTNDNNRPEIVYFQLLEKHGIREVSDHLIGYHLAGKLHFLQLIDLLGISRYERIQDFKKTIYANTFEI